MTGGGGGSVTGGGGSITGGVDVRVGGGRGGSVTAGAGGEGPVKAGKEEYEGEDGQQARKLPALQATLPEPVVQVEVRSGPSQQDTCEKIEVL